MKAIVITRKGGPEVLEVHEVPTPEPQGDQVRVRVLASGLNRADLMQCRGSYPAPPGSPADIPGLASRNSTACNRRNHGASRCDKRTALVRGRMQRKLFH